MDKNLVRDTIVPSSVTLLSQEGYMVDGDGVKTTTLGDWAKGKVHLGRPAGEGSEIVIHGETDCYCDGSSVNLAKDDPVVAGSDGCLYKATVGTHDVRGRMCEACTSKTLARVFLY